MKTTATNRKLRVLITDIKNKTLIPRPEFQRRLVWTNKDKLNFLDTVLNSYPFPEIYIAAGDVDPETGEGNEMLVDGQQRISTLYQYFTASNELKLGNDIKPYAELSQEEKINFLEYDVVVRDLGKMSVFEIKAVFEKINATSYALNAMEIHNARFDGEFKAFADQITRLPFFNEHRIFSINDIRRMKDLSYVLVIIITIMSNYFNRDDELERYLSIYNDEFEMQDYLGSEIERVLSFIEFCNFDSHSRAWKKSDLFTLIIELHRILIKQGLELSPYMVGERVKEFYRYVESFVNGDISTEKLKKLPYNRDIPEYAKATSQATNDRGSRIKRGAIIQKVILGEED